MDVRRVGVVGAGTMGNGIAHVFARSGFDVLLCDVEQSFLDRACNDRAKISIAKWPRARYPAEDKTAALRRIEPAVDRAKLADCDFIVEAATEKFEIKADAFPRAR